MAATLMPIDGSARRPSSEAAQGTRERLSIVVPMRDEAAGIEAFTARLADALAPLDVDAELLFVDDGSTDGSAARVGACAERDPRIALLVLSRNFGKEAAVSAGLAHASGDAVIVMDADGQDPPECIGRMLATWREGADVVAMRRVDRRVDSRAKRWSARLFYRALGTLCEVELPANVGDFRLLSRRAVDALNALPERNRYMKGLFAWVGFERVTLDYRREARAAGDSRFGLSALVELALDGITAFSIRPLRLASWAGLAAALGAFVYGLSVVARTLLFGEPVAGFPTLVALISFLGGVQLLAIGILGEYVGRMFVETKRRPLYLVDRWRPPRARSGEDERGRRGA